jgi:hypothetical protein
MLKNMTIVKIGILNYGNGIGEEDKTEERILH